MYSVLVILMVVVSVLMCFIVVIQESKGGGLASGFASSNQIMGVRKTTDFIEKATWTLAIAMVVLSVASAYFVPTTADQKSVVLKEKATMPAVPMQQQSKGLPAASGANAQGGNNGGATQAPAQAQPNK